MTGIFHLNLLLILAWETQYFASPLWFATDYIAGNVETSRRGSAEKGGRQTNRHMFIISVLMNDWD